MRRVYLSGCDDTSGKRWRQLCVNGLLARQARAPQQKRALPYSV